MRAHLADHRPAPACIGALQHPAQHGGLPARTAQECILRDQHFGRAAQNHNRIMTCQRMIGARQTGFTAVRAARVAQHAEGLRGSIAGGGRYDGLVGMFLNEDVPAVGGSLGLERILVIMQERGMFPDLALHHDVLVARMDDEAVPEGLSLCALLRGAGYSAVMFPEARKIAQQFRYAEEIGARWVAIVGTREAREGVVTMKHLASGEQTTVSREELLTWMGGLPST